VSQQGGLAHGRERQEVAREGGLEEGLASVAEGEAVVLGRHDRIIIRSRLRVDLPSRVAPPGARAQPAAGVRT
jgi:hypothetical protein